MCIHHNMFDNFLNLKGISDEKVNVIGFFLIL